MGFFSKFFETKGAQSATVEPKAEEPVAADFTSAIVLHLRGELEPALAAYRQMAEQYPDDNLALFFAAAIQAGQGAVEEAVETLRFLSGRAAEANQSISQVITLELAAQVGERSYAGRIPAIAELIVGLGDAIKAGGFVREAAVCFEIAAGQVPDRANVLHKLGDALHDLKMYDYAESVLVDALKHAPNHWASLYTYAVLLQDLGRDAEALAYYEKAAVFNPDHANCRNNYGAALLRTNRLEEALAQCSAAAELEPGSAFIKVNLGNIYYLMQDYQKAGASFREAISLDAKLPAAYFGLATVEQALGSESGKVQERYLQALTLNPAIAEAHHALGNLLAASGNSEALQHFSAALRLNANLKDLHRDCAKACLQLGKRDEALEQLKLALEKNPADVQAINMIASMEANASA